MTRTFLILNVFLLFVLAVLWQQGLVWPLFRDDSSHITVLIVGWLIVGLVESFRGRWEKVSDIADDLVFLGLLGTVIGFALALTNITPERVASGATGEMVGAFVQGARTALYTTVVGAIGNYWLRLNHFFARV